MITVGEWLWGVNFKFHTSQVEIENTHWNPHFCLYCLLIKPCSKYTINTFFFILIGDEIPKDDCTKLLDELAGAEDEDGFFAYGPFLDKLCGKA